MKTFLFVRGPDSEFKAKFVHLLMNELNPDVNHVTGVLISPKTWIVEGEPGSMKAANKTAKNHVKRILGGDHSEPFVVIDSELPTPQSWQSYYALANDVAPNTIAYGIDVLSPDDQVSEARKNLQESNVRMFISTMAKYQCVKNEQDVKLVLQNFSIDV